MTVSVSARLAPVAERSGIQRVPVLLALVWAARFLVFMAVLWLVSPWFGRRDMALLRCHRMCLGVVLVTVVLGALASPGLAFSFGGRLSGVLWPIPATQVAHYAAIVFGTTALLW